MCMIRVKKELLREGFFNLINDKYVEPHHVNNALKIGEYELI